MKASIGFGRACGGLGCLARGRVRATTPGARALALFAFVIGLLCLPSAADDPSPDTWADRDNFPEAYSILTSDRVMFPDDISDWPLKIDSTHQLFIDDFLISEIDQLTREFHQPVKCPDNPLMPGWTVAVLYDSDRGLFRMWNGRRHLTSSDGVHWEESYLGTNIERMEYEGGLRGLMYIPGAPESEGRYKAIVDRRGSDNVSRGFFLYHSRDGLNWELRPGEPILMPTLNTMRPCEFRPTGAGDPREFQWGAADHIQSIGAGDTTTFRYDGVLKRYIYDGKFNLYFPPEKITQMGTVHENGKPILRLRTFSESEDGIHWSAPRMALYPDRLDPPDRQIYSHVGFVYESMWVGLIRAMRILETGWKQVDLQLSYSRDGRHWSRPDRRKPFIPLGDADSWEPDYSGPTLTAPVLVGDKLYFHYFGSRHFARDQIPVEDFRTYIGLAKLRRDGFASLNAGNAVGRVVTRPLAFEGKRLFVNADMDENGWVKAAILSRDLETIEGYALDDAVPMAESTTAGRITWAAQKELASEDGEHVRILFQLKDARLYSFWVE